VPALVELNTEQKNKSALSERYHCSNCPRDEEDIQLSDDGYIVCANCGSQISDNPQLQNEVSFGENAQGAAVVQGTTIQEGQRRTHVQGLGHRGAEAPDREDRLRTANVAGTEEIKRINEYLTPKLGELTIGRAANLFSLAKLHAFQRPISENAAISIYTACRENKENTVLLIDLAEIIHVNVFELGAAYKKFLDRIDLTAKYHGSNNMQVQQMVEPEPLIRRFAKRLEFGNDSEKVSTDACSILRRMKRDWMVTGRQPMGLVGACLIIAARMNNYRRTLREVVYVVRAGEMTILKRLNEFSTTAAAKLTVDQFRRLREDELLNSSIKEGLPPSLVNPRKRKRSKKVDDTESIASSRQSSLAPSEASNITDTTEVEPRRDKDGFAIPALPPPRARSQSENAASPPPSLDGASDTTQIEYSDDEEEEEPKPKRGRPKKIPLPEVHVTPDDLAAEEAVEKDIAEHMTAIESDASITSERGPGWFKAKALADAAREEERKASKWKLSDLDLASEDIDSDEFEDDPEVKFCKLTEREVAVKEQIWVTHNHDWLRAQQERLLQEQLASARGKKKRQGPRRKMARRGDGSVLGSSPVASAADASLKMMDARSKRHKYSRHVDYAVLQTIYAGEDDSSQAGSPSASPSRAGSRSVSASPSPAIKRKVSFEDEGARDRSPSATPSVASSAAVAGAKQPAAQQDDEMEDEEEEYEASIADSLPLFGEEDEEMEYYEEEEDPLEIAHEFGVDTGDR
jgi:transcription factor IIIB subunit 2